MSVTYYTATGQPSFTAAVTIGLPRWEKPFEDVNDRLVFRQRFCQRADYYSPLALNTAYDGDVSYVQSGRTYYLVGEEGFEQREARLMEWDRVYAAVPSARTEYTSVPYEFPAILPVMTVGAYVTATNYMQSGPARMFINAAITASIGNQVSVSYRYVSGGTTFNRVTGVYVRDYSLGGIITDSVPELLSNTSITILQVARAYFDAGRQFPLAVAARADVDYNYVLAAAGSAPSFTLQGRQKFVLATGEEVKFVSRETIPTALTYLSWIASTTVAHIVAEDDQWSRWMGNIYEQRTVKVYAQ